jgi:hypothetical protein
MAFSDPQTITINAVAQTLPRTSSGINQGAFATSDGAYKESISHTYGNRTRRVLRLDASKVAADPLNPTQNKPYSMSAYLVVDIPTFGYSVTEQKQVVDGLVAYLAATSGAKVTQLLGGES